VHGRETFFGGGGIEWCRPGGTALGQPLSVEQLGETEVSPELFQEYLTSQGADRFRGDRYDLFRHNCNNFSEETAQFLVGRGIPAHILALPGEILASPMGQMLAPMLQQAMPSGSSIPFTPAPSNPGAAPASAAPSTPAITFPHTQLITFDQPLQVEGLRRKVEELNSQQEEAARLTVTEVQAVLAMARGETATEQWAALWRLRSWPRPAQFPLLDILRLRVLAASTGGEQLVAAQQVFTAQLSPGDQVTSMLGLRGLCNLLSRSPRLPGLAAWSCLEPLLEAGTALLCQPGPRPGLQVGVASLAYNLTALLAGREDQLEAWVYLGSSLGTSLLPSLTDEEAQYRALLALGNVLKAGPVEAVELLHSLELEPVLEQCKQCQGKVAGCATQILKLMQTTN